MSFDPASKRYLTIRRLRLSERVMWEINASRSSVGAPHAFDASEFVAWLENQPVYCTVPGVIKLPIVFDPQMSVLFELIRLVSVGLSALGLVQDLAGHVRASLSQSFHRFHTFIGSSIQYTSVRLSVLQ